jgi:hypothetical protein
MNSMVKWRRMRVILEVNVKESVGVELPEK